ncbi:MAG: hypothetical protein PHO01_12815, partial [Desulfotomaculaceae bacterium]|nr:hypothetical protein [Desulfotomaculaceae bacterium]
MIYCRDLNAAILSAVLILIFPFFFFGSCRAEAAGGIDSVDRLLDFAVEAVNEESMVDLDGQSKSLNHGGAFNGASVRHFAPSVQWTGSESQLPEGKINLQAQAPGPELDWAKRYGGAYDDIIRFVGPTADNGYIMVGETYSPSNGGSDVYLVKTNASGDVAWQKNIGGVGNDRGYCVRQTSDGGYIVVGDTESAGAGGYDIYLARMNAAGSVLWEKTYGGTADDYGSSVWVNSDDTFIIAGETYSYGYGGADIYLIKANAAGTQLWGVYTGGSNHDWLYCAQTTGDGGIVFAGGTMSYGAGKEDILLGKTNASADTILWSMMFGGAEDDSAFDLQQTGDGGFAVAGYSASAGGGGFDAYLVKTDASGNRQWENYYGGQDDDEAISVRQTADGG